VNVLSAPLPVNSSIPVVSVKVSDGMTIRCTAALRNVGGKS